MHRSRTLNSLNHPGAPSGHSLTQLTLKQILTVPTVPAQFVEMENRDRLFYLAFWKPSSLTMLLHSQHFYKILSNFYPSLKLSSPAKDTSHVQTAYSPTLLITPRAGIGCCCCCCSCFQILVPSCCTSLYPTNHCYPATSRSLLIH